MNVISARSSPPRAAVVTGPRAVRVTGCDVPEPGPGQVRIRVEGCGVCASSLPVWEGRPWFSYPLPAGSPGHEGWGVVDALGPGPAASRFAPGDRVAFLSDQGYATHAIATEDRVLGLPPALDGLPFPGEAFACAMNIFRRSGIGAGQSVAIVGAGFLGAVLTALAAAAGARVVALARRDFPLDLAMRLGAVAGVRIGEPGAAVADAQAHTGGEGFPRVIEAAGVQDALDLATELTAVRGRLIIAGFHQDGARRVDLQTWNWRGLDVVNAHERDPGAYLRGMADAVTAILDGRLDPRTFLTHAFPLADTGAALEALTRRPPGFLKAWVAMEA